MNRTDLVDVYYDWLVEKIEIFDSEGGSLSFNYSWTLRRLFNTEFQIRTCRIPLHETGSYDIDRANDGLYLREKFAESCEVASDFWCGLISSGCSILEMMIALAIRMESNYLFDPSIGDRTAQWFWNMFESLGLMDYDNDNYSEDSVSEILNIFLNREYYSDGKGGLFTFQFSNFMPKHFDIWTQMTRWIGENFN